MRVVEQRVDRLVAAQVDDAQPAAGRDLAGPAVAGPDLSIENDGCHSALLSAATRARPDSGRKTRLGSSGPGPATGDTEQRTPAGRHSAGGSGRCGAVVRNSSWPCAARRVTQSPVRAWPATKLRASPAGATLVNQLTQACRSRRPSRYVASSSSSRLRALRRQSL